MREDFKQFFKDQNFYNTYDFSRLRNPQEFRNFINLANLSMPKYIDKNDLHYFEKGNDMKIYMDVDVLIGLQFGDEGKGKISEFLQSNQYYIHRYDAICKFNGGGNSGHTVYKDGNKYVFHYLNSGILNYKTDCVIGGGAIVNPLKLIQEIWAVADEMFKNDKENFDMYLTNVTELMERIKIYKNCHITLAHHVYDDKNGNKIGTTGTGNGQTLSEKYERVGLRFDAFSNGKEFAKSMMKNGFHDLGESVEDKQILHYMPELLEKLWETCLIDENYFYKQREIKILMEGSQGMSLDIDFGEYPYVTSSHMHPSFAFTSCNLPIPSHHKIIGVAKPYETYSGFKKDMLIPFKKSVADKISSVGEEVGATTGRKRHVGVLDLDRLIANVRNSGTNHVYMNKIDVLQKVDAFNLKYKSFKSPVEFKNWDLMKDFIEEKLNAIQSFQTITYSSDPEGKDLK